MKPPPLGEATEDARSRRGRIRGAAVA